MTDQNYTPDNNGSFKTSMMLAVLLHILLFGALFVKFAPSMIHQPGSGQVNIVKATVINPASLNKQIADLKREEQKEKAAQERQIKEQQLKAEQAAEEKIRQEKLAQQQQQQEQQKREQQVAQQQALVKKQAIEQQQALIQQKLAAEQAAKATAAKIVAQKQAAQKAQQLKLKQQKAAELAAKRRAEQKQKLLAQKQLQAAQQKMLQQQLSQEQKQLTAAAASAVHNQQIQTELDKYKAAIVQAISQNWIVPSDADKNLSCQLLIQVGPGGIVLSVQVVSSSGDDALDNSAKTAVLKSSPLPVPSDPQLFDNFRELRLTVKPENIVMK